MFEIYIYSIYIIIAVAALDFAFLWLELLLKLTFIILNVRLVFNMQSMRWIIKLKYALELIILLFFVSHTVKSTIAIIVIQSEIPGC